MRGCWRPNINFIFWPHCYDRHVVSFLFSWCWGLLHRGFPRAPSVGCSFHYHISSLTLWKSAGNCIGGFRGLPRSGVAFPTTYRLYCLEVCWQLLWGFSEFPFGQVWSSLPHLVSNSLGVCWQLHRGFPRSPSVGCGLPYHISSLTLLESAGNCFGTQTQLS